MRVGDNKLDQTHHVPNDRSEPLRVLNVPQLRDITTMIKLLTQMGIKVSTADARSIELNAAGLDNPVAPYDLVKTMRASVLALGANGIRLAPSLGV